MFAPADRPLAVAMTLSLALHGQRIVLGDNILVERPSRSENTPLTQIENLTVVLVSTTLMSEYGSTRLNDFIREGDCKFLTVNLDIPQHEWPPSQFKNTRSATMQQLPGLVADGPEKLGSLSPLMNDTIAQMIPPIELDPAHSRCREATRHIVEQLRESAENITTLEQVREQLSSKIAASADEIQQLRAEVLSAKEDVAARVATEASQDKRQSDNEIQTLQSQLKTLREMLEQTTARADEAEARATSTIEAQAEAIKLANLKAAEADKEHRHEILKLQTEVATARRAAEVAKDSGVESTSRSTSAGSLSNADSNGRATVMGESSGADETPTTTEMESLQKKLNAAETETKRLRKALSKEKNSRARSESARLDVLERELDDARSEIAEWKGKHSEVQDKLILVTRSHSALRQKLSEAGTAQCCIVHRCLPSALTSPCRFRFCAVNSSKRSSNFAEKLQWKLRAVEREKKERRELC